MDYRVGIGFDLHRLDYGKKLVIGGVEIPHDKGWVAHSDGDVLLHALTDALLGAVGKGDIGELFPDKNPKWKGKSSDFFVRQATKIIKEEGYQVVNIDAFILLEKPKILPFREKIIKNIQTLTGCSNIFLKGKTFEKLGEIGQEKAGACEVIVLLKRSHK